MNIKSIKHLKEVQLLLFLALGKLILVKKSHEYTNFYLCISSKNNIKTNELWLRGGFPESLLSKNDTNSFNWRKDFSKACLERDIPQLGPRIPAETLERFWTMLARRSKKQ